MKQLDRDTASLAYADFFELGVNDVRVMRRGSHERRMRGCGIRKIAGEVLAYLAIYAIKATHPAIVREWMRAKVLCAYLGSVIEQGAFHDRREPSGVDKQQECKGKHILTLYPLLRLSN
jgi:hypothetical protein